ncbi:uncharacterized protein LOC144712527 [Wolffia australiana]
MGIEGGEMGKAERERPPSASLGGEEGRRGQERRACSIIGWGRARIGRRINGRCVAALLLGFAVILSAGFGLPSFNGGPHRGRRHDRGGSDIVASFQLQRPRSLLEANVSQLRHDIFEEIGVPNSSVNIISLDPLAASNWTNVVFGIWPYPRNSNISSVGLSILRSTFVALFTEQSTLWLTRSLFGNPLFFQVLEFPGGIAVVPPQGGFPLEEPRMLFNFTLNFSINQVYGKMGELKNQLSSGLHLTDFENLYFILTNALGSTMSPPTVVQTSILLAVGNHPPSKSRLKELAESINPERNLGLNHTVFGRVKQIRLSAFFRHTINSSCPPTPPQPSPTNLHHHHPHHHHHRRHHHDRHHHDRHHRVHHHHHHHHRQHHRRGQHDHDVGQSRHHHPHHQQQPSYLPSPAPAPSPKGRAALAPTSHLSGPSKKPKTGNGPMVDSLPPLSSPSSSPVPYVIISQVHPPDGSFPAKSLDKRPSSGTAAQLNFVLSAFVSALSLFLFL